MIMSAFLLAVVMFITFGGNWLIGQNMADRPIVVGSLVGLVLGDLQSGVLMGAALEAVFMGAVNVGGATPLNPSFGTVLGAGFAMLSGGGVEIAITLAIPLALLGGLLETTMSVVLSFFAGRFDKLALEGNDKAIVAMHYGLWFLRYIVFAIVVFIAIMSGATPVKLFVENIPEVIMRGLAACGGLIPAIGFAMLLKMLWNNKLSIYYILGFVIVAYIKIPLIALAIIGTVIAVAIAYRDYEILNLKSDKFHTNNNSNSIMDDDEEFFS
ncbi:PTS mannose transporter subunit IIC [Gilliamella apis]|uniref:PTS mannose/fructose/sorbose/N-acetylgalactosamine transporter subunit IIC n=1 Tax=Gilliamella apis TaxID=1970738 RepID=UPI000A338099|nr:PTS sugar transporter subunit IIC [Gilliamella apis]OTQ71728.1 PTS mannose transporter subunit IIC [Gilliamella apis]OTQ76891.1 PTS mannose transporter subunit IIC [Gilliamella apis]